MMMTAETDRSEARMWLPSSKGLEMGVSGVVLRLARGAPLYSLDGID